MNEHLFSEVRKKSQERGFADEVWVRFCKTKRNKEHVLGRYVTCSRDTPGAIHLWWCSSAQDFVSINPSEDKV